MRWLLHLLPGAQHRPCRRHVVLFCIPDSVQLANNQWQTHSGSAASKPWCLMSWNVCLCKCMVCSRDLSIQVGFSGSARCLAQEGDMAPVGLAIGGLSCHVFPSLGTVLSALRLLAAAGICMFRFAVINASCQAPRTRAGWLHNLSLYRGCHVEPALSGAGLLGQQTHAAQGNHCL